MANAALLHDILKKIESKDQSPLVAQRTLMRIAHGYNEGDTRETAHNLFDWFCEFSRTGLSAEDQATMDIDPEAIQDDTERKQLIRRQAKIAKRAKAKNRSFTSKVTPELVVAVERTLNHDDKVAAADQLSFAAGCAPVLTPDELVELLDRIYDTIPSCSPSGALRAAREAVEQVTGLGVWKSRVTAAESVWMLSHAPLIEGSDVRVGETWKAVKGKKRGIKVYKDSYPEYVSLVGKTPKDLSKYTIFDPTEHFWERVAARMPVEYKPSAPYERSATELTSVVEFLRPRLVSGQMFDLAEEMFEERKAIIQRGDFDYPSYAWIDEVKDGYRIQTIVSELELQQNGTYMGNCTYSVHKSAYKEGKGVLYKITPPKGVDGDAVVNSDFRPTGTGGKWVLRETQRRHQNAVQRGDGVNAINTYILNKLEEGRRRTGNGAGQ